MSIGKDLASIRKKQGLTLEEIQSSIKIPMSTLESIENDDIFSEYESNKTYVRSFVRSFARTLHIPEEQIVDALDEYESGTYSGSLIKASQDFTAATDSDDTTLINKEEGDTDFDLSKVEAPEIAELAPGSPSVKNVNWADMGKRFSLQHSTRKVRITVISVIILLLVLLVSGYFFWDSFSNNSDDAETDSRQTENTTPSLTAPLIPPSTADSVLVNENQTMNNNTGSESVALPDEDITSDLPEPSTETTDQESMNEGVVENIPSTTMTALPDTLTLLVYAAYEKLEPVRVTSDFNWRTNPFWMEQGLAYKFDFRDSILVRGQYSRMLLLFNGHVIEDPVSQFFSEEFDSILLTRDDLRDPVYLQSTDGRLPDNTELPSSITYGIRY